MDPRQPVRPGWKDAVTAVGVGLTGTAIYLVPALALLALGQACLLMVALSYLRPPPPRRRTR